jgi:GH15 family glucan-1,4-alpha-glucosidase
VKRKDGFAPIGSYAAIGDGRTVALVASDGSIDFASLPAMHCPTTFGAMLDPERGGRFVLAPTGRFDVERRYVGDSNVLETTYRAGSGVVRVTDAMTTQNGGLLPWVEIVRRIEGLSGEVELEWLVEPRFEWGSRMPQFTRRRGVPIAEAGSLELGVHAFDAGEPEIRDDAVRAGLIVRDGESGFVVVCCTEDQPIPIPSRADVERRLEGTVAAWRRWLAGSSYDGPWADAVRRSALALKLLVYAPLGAIVAAPTTSLPERVGGDRNYDYRYMWVRDTAFTLDALMRLDLPEQVHESFSCLLKAVRTTAPEMDPFYSIEGHRAERYVELDHLRGYRGSRPVRHGNAARRQLQLGSWGDLLETADLYVECGNAIDESTGQLLASCIDRLCMNWRDGDSGIWELDDPRQYSASNISVWMAFDRALRLAAEGQLPGKHAERWREERSAVVRYLEEHCWSEEIGAYLEFAGATSELDAAVARAARMGWPSVNGDRFDRTLAAIRERLDAGDGLLYRTSRLAGEEGAFVACSFWTAEALARRGRADEAADLFERMLAYANDVGLLAEQIDPGTGEQLGSFPQGLSHLALINAAGAISDARGAGASAREDATAR